MLWVRGQVAIELLWISFLLWFLIIALSKLNQSIATHFEQINQQHTELVQQRLGGIHVSNND